MNIGQITSGQVATSVWANATRTLTDWGRPTTSESSGAAFTTVAVGNGSKGSWVQLIAASGAAAKYLLLCVSGGNANNSFIDIGTGAAASEVAVIKDVIYGLNTVAGDNVWTFLLPVAIATGTRFSVRAQSNAAINLSVALTILE